MILTVTLNPALDITYHVDGLVPGATHRVPKVDERLGGKGLNVASVLAQLGEPAVATGLMRDGPPMFVPIAAPPRRTVVITDGRQATGFWEPGPAVTEAEWESFRHHFAVLLRGARVVVFSGSLPGGLPTSAYAELITTAHTAGTRTILDTSGEALAAGLAAGPDIAKPNATELADLLAIHIPSRVESGPDSTHHGMWITTPPGGAGVRPHESAAGHHGDAAAGNTGVAKASQVMPSLTHTYGGRPEMGKALSRGGETTIVASYGAEGLRANGWWARPPRHIDGNPTGAGDACVAALARGLLHGTPWPDLLRDAVALSAAAVAAPVAGLADLDVYRELLPHVIVEES